MTSHPHRILIGLGGRNSIARAELAAHRLRHGVVWSVTPPTLAPSVAKLPATPTPTDEGDWNSVSMTALLHHAASLPAAEHRQARPVMLLVDNVRLVDDLDAAGVTDLLTVLHHGPRSGVRLLISVQDVGALPTRLAAELLARPELAAIEKLMTPTVPHVSVIVRDKTPSPTDGHLNAIRRCLRQQHRAHGAVWYAGDHPERPLGLEAGWFQVVSLCVPANLDLAAKTVDSRRRHRNRAQTPVMFVFEVDQQHRWTDQDDALLCTIIDEGQELAVCLLLVTSAPADIPDQTRRRVLGVTSTSTRRLEAAPV
jgi:hypothetical protein